MDRYYLILLCVFLFVMSGCDSERKVIGTGEFQTSDFKMPKTEIPNEVDFNYDRNQKWINAH